MHRSAELLQRRTSSDAEHALGVINEGLSISVYSEKLFEMKAETLFMVCTYLISYSSKFFWYVKLFNILQTHLSYLFSKKEQLVKFEHILTY